MSDSVACNTPQTYASQNSWHAIYFSQTLFFFPLKHQHAHPYLGGHVVCLDEYVYVIYYHLGIMDYFVNLPSSHEKREEKMKACIWGAWQWLHCCGTQHKEWGGKDVEKRCRWFVVWRSRERVHLFFVIWSLLKSSLHNWNPWITHSSQLSTLFTQVPQGIPTPSDSMMTSSLDTIRLETVQSNPKMILFPD